MKTNHRIIRWLALLLLALNPRPSIVFAQSYTVVDLGTPGGKAYGINDKGQVVGGYGQPFIYSGGGKTVLNAQGSASDINNEGQVVGNISTGAFLYSGGKISNLPFTTNGTAHAINDSGQVVGSIGNRAVLYSGGLVKDLGTLGGLNAAAYDINNNGQVVGQSQASSLAEQAFLYSNGAMKDLLPDSQRSIAYGINNLGQVVGWYSTWDGVQGGFLYSAGVIKDLGSLGGGSTVPVAINDSGQIVGSSETPDGVYHPFLYNKGSMVDLNTLIPTIPGLVITDVEDINNSGQIAASGYVNGSQFNQATFLLEPIPEPATCALFALASLAFFLPASIFQHRTKRLCQKWGEVEGKTHRSAQISHERAEVTASFWRASSVVSGPVAHEKELVACPAAVRHPCSSRRRIIL
jgi:probable HAF family extracellular repeat protein